MQNKKIKVLIIDDSAVVRNTLKEVLESDPEISVMDTAIDPYYAAEIIKHEKPDVITLDVEMPRMDGITFLKKLMSQHPIPVVMCSNLTIEGCETTLQALDLGAVDIITKPKVEVKKFLDDSRVRIIDAIKAAAKVKVKKITSPVRVVEKLTADAMIKPSLARPIAKITDMIVAVGASTGGTEALKVFLEVMPIDCPPIVIVQHMPENFTLAFANRLNTYCSIEVKEAVDGDVLTKGKALIAPGNKHLMVQRSGNKYYVQVKDGPLVCRHRPSVDVLFRSVAQSAAKNSTGIIMTGMGDDGARGLFEMRNSGAYTIAQDETTSVVFGMPHEAIKLGAVMETLPIEKIAGLLLRICADHSKGEKHE